MYRQRSSSLRWIQLPSTDASDTDVARRGVMLGKIKITVYMTTFTFNPFYVASFMSLRQCFFTPVSIQISGTIFYQINDFFILRCFFQVFKVVVFTPVSMQISGIEVQFEGLKQREKATSKRFTLLKFFQQLGLDLDYLNSVLRSSQHTNQQREGDRTSVPNC